MWQKRVRHKARQTHYVRHAPGTAKYRPAFGRSWLQVGLQKQQATFKIPVELSLPTPGTEELPKQSFRAQCFQPQPCHHLLLIFLSDLPCSFKMEKDVVYFKKLEARIFTTKKLYRYISRFTQCVHILKYQDTSTNMYRFLFFQTS